MSSVGAGRPRGYHFWEKNEGGRLFFTDTYATTDTIDDAVARVEAMREPWLLWVAFTAAHAPHDEPPASLHSSSSLETPADRYDAVVEALDREIGRLLDGLGPERLARTTVILVGDNVASFLGKSTALEDCQGEIKHLQELARSFGMSGQGPEPMPATGD